MKHILIVDDEASICWGLERAARGLGCRASIAATAEDALGIVQNEKIDLAIIDVRLPGMDGLSLIQRVRAAGLRFPFIVMTAFGDLATAVRAMSSGAFEYVIKPFELDPMERAVRAALSMQDDPTLIAEEASATSPQIVGTSPVLQEVFKRIAMVAPTEACVHISGESGTGKELVARAIHQFSQRKDANFVVVHAAAINVALAESELFGHVRGAFTGAEHDHVGLIEQANGGTLFFDEVADIPMELQVKLLRALEYGEIMPVGGSRPVQSDFRVVSATHRDLRQRVEQGLFREDLYFRLVTFRIELPPLRQRRQDIPQLAERFVATMSAKNGIAKPSISAEVTAILASREWVGNVRELRNVMEHATILARGGVIRPEHLPSPEVPAERGGAVSIEPLIESWVRAQFDDSPDIDDLHRRFLELVERPLFEEVLRKHGGQFVSAARTLGLHRVTLRKRVNDYRSRQRRAALGRD